MSLTDRASLRLATIASDSYAGLDHRGGEPGDDLQDALMSRAQDAQERLKSNDSKMAGLAGHHRRTCPRLPRAI